MNTAPIQTAQWSPDQHAFPIPVLSSDKTWLPKEGLYTRSALQHKADDVSAFTFILSQSTKRRTQAKIIFKRKMPKQNLHSKCKITKP